MRVICDTNIWYKIGSGKIKKSDFKNASLVATWNNLFEIGNSENLYKSPIKVKQACSALIEFATAKIFTHPIDYVANIYTPSFDPDRSEGEYMYDEMIKVNSMIDDDIQKQVQENTKVIKANVDNIRRGIGDAVQIFNDEAQKINDNIRQTTGKLAHRKTNALPSAAQFISTLILTKTGLDITLNNLSPISLFTETMSLFFKDLELGHRKMQVNDWIDLLNLIYVRDGDLYWTFEKKWLLYIKAAGFENLIFNP